MKLYQVDAFAEQPFEGNPAGVCVLPGPAQEQWMQHVAMEMNLAETAFLYAVEDGWNLRWFTPAVEVELCGHATLASAHILWETGRLAMESPAVFHTRSGRLTAEREGDRITLDFPAKTDWPSDNAAAIAEALGAPVIYAGYNGMDFIAELENESAVRRLNPDMTALTRVIARGVIATARSATPGCDFVSRFFAPAVGIPEDPVTGSAHCCLGPFWQKRMNKRRFTAYQASRRGGWVSVEVCGDRVRLGGKAVTVFEIEMI